MSDSIRLLLVDDEAPNLDTFRRVYRKLYNIQIAPSGSAGLELLNSNEFDVVVSDFGMPGMSGAEFVSKVKSTQPIAVVMITGFVNHPEVQELETSGDVFAVVGKPWDKQSIIDVIARATECTKALRDAE
jgi:response regulator RpfG family c-di-GMP phosphodiesterase